MSRKGIIKADGVEIGASFTIRKVPGGRREYEGEISGLSDSDLAMIDMAKSTILVSGDGAEFKVSVSRANFAEETLKFVSIG